MKVFIIHFVVAAATTNNLATVFLQKTKLHICFRLLLESLRPTFTPLTVSTGGGIVTEVRPLDHGDFLRVCALR